MTSVQLLTVLRDPDDTAALAVLQRYFGPRLGEKNAYTGSVFDT